MNRKTYSIILLLGILVILTIHLSALYFFLYWRLWWIDIILHYITGLWVGLAVVWLVVYSGYWFIEPKPISRLAVFIFSLTAALLIGIFWEVFEYFVGATFVNIKGYWPDTIGDIFSDLAGGLTSYFVFTYWLGKNHYIKNESKD